MTMMAKKLYEESRGGDAASPPPFLWNNIFFVVKADIELTVSPILALTLQASCLEDGGPLSARITAWCHHAS